MVDLISLQKEFKNNSQHNSHNLQRNNNLINNNLNSNFRRNHLDLLEILTSQSKILHNNRFRALRGTCKAQRLALEQAKMSRVRLRNLCRSLLSSLS